MTERSTHRQVVPREPQAVRLRRRRLWRMGSGGRPEHGVGKTASDRYHGERMMVRGRVRRFGRRIWVATQEFNSCPMVGQEFFIFEVNGMGLPRWR